MSTALSVFHGRFGRASLYRLNKPLAPHAHREGHLIFLVEGARGTVTVEDADHAADLCNAVAVSPWQPHAFFPGDFGAGAVYLTLYIQPRWFLEMSAGAPVMRFGAPTVALDTPIRRALGAIVRHLADGGTGPAFEGELFELTQLAFAKSWAHASCDTPALMPRVADYRIRNAMRLMRERVADSCVLDRIARDAGLSRPHFYKLFRQNIGVTPNMYLNTLRLEQSIDRLTRSDDPVTVIGLDLGFASQASFTRFFSNNIGIAPTDYRRVSAFS